MSWLLQVESLKGRRNLNFEDVSIENENNLPVYQRHDTEDSSSDDELFDDFEL